MRDLLASLNEQQAEAVRQIAGPILILAGAGSGKTKALTTKIAYLLEKGVKPWNILAITFTNKAAKEMRQRVDALVGPSAKDVWLYTFHGFCNQLLRRDIIEPMPPAYIQLLRAAHSTHQYIPHGPVHCFQLRFQFLHLARPLLCFISLYRLFCREARCR